MSRTLKVAAVQMDSRPAPLDERLHRTGCLVDEAADAGAQLVVLPELFNSGYEFDDRNFALAEPIDGETVAWMKATAQRRGVHLVGSLLLRDQEDVYNAALLVAPDGRLWRYNKNYPFLWERTYFREGRDIAIADTDLGKLGMLICWDSAHADMWERYAGKVDAMIVVSCPPKLSSADLVFPDGLRLNIRSLGSLMKTIYTDEEYFPGADMDDHAAWLGIPVIHTSGGGAFRSRLPLPALSVGAYLLARPDLWGRLQQASEVVLEAGYDPQTKIVDANGDVASRVQAAGDGWTMAEVPLAETPPHPRHLQPRMRTPSLAYFFADVFGAAMVIPLYRRGVRRQWGEHMAPTDPRSQLWLALLLFTAVAAWMLGGSARRPKSRRRR